MQVLVEVETGDGQRHSILLQNAETVKLVGRGPVDEVAAPARLAPSALAAREGAESDNRQVDLRITSHSSEKSVSFGNGIDTEVDTEEGVASRGGSASSSMAVLGAVGGSSTSTSTSAELQEQADGAGGDSSAECGAELGGIGRWWNAISVSEMRAGDQVMVLRQVLPGTLASVSRRALVRGSRRLAARS